MCHNDIHWLHVVNIHFENNHQRVDTSPSVNWWLLLIVKKTSETAIKIAFRSHHTNVHIKKQVEVDDGRVGEGCIAIRCKWVPVEELLHVELWPRADDAQNMSWYHHDPNSIMISSSFTNSCLLKVSWLGSSGLRKITWVSSIQEQPIVNLDNRKGQWKVRNAFT